VVCLLVLVDQTDSANQNTSMKKNYHYATREMIFDLPSISRHCRPLSAAIGISQGFPTIVVARERAPGGGCDQSQEMRGFPHRTTLVWHLSTM